MRDLLLVLLVFGSVPLILKRPYLGLLMWVWLSVMNPHRLAYGFAYSLPFAQVIAIATIASFLFHLKERYRFPMNVTTFSLIAFVLWICVSPNFSFLPEYEFEFWLRVIKIQVMVLITFFLVGNREQLHRLAWVLALSIGFYGIKGGYFTVLTGGSYRVWGPDGSFVGDNNSIALATIMAIPLMRYLQLQAKSAWIRHAYLVAMLLCAASAVGSQSRGALIAILAMTVFLWLKSRNKLVLGLVLIVAILLVFWAMPDSWNNRMGTISTYGEDSSAMGRINAWTMAWNLAVSRFPIGGGFTIYNSLVYAKFAPDPTTVLAAHSIYFQVLGEHGFMGLFIFISIFVSAWFSGSWTIKKTRGRSDLEWARDLASMCQVSLIGYAAGGAFLSLTYYDFPFYVVAMLVVLRKVVSREIGASVVKKSPFAFGAALPALESRAPQ